MASCPDERDLDRVLARFFGLESPPPVDRRGVPRSSYHVQMAYAAYDDLRFPEATEFQPVEGIDISTSGVSFLADDRPTCELVVLRLGSLADRAVYASARIVRVDRDRPKYGPRHVVGCQFEDRLKPPGQND